jgi:hypothetical protein
VISPSKRQTVLRSEDQRRESRKAGDGIASIRARENRPGPWSEAKLVDFSDNGFRLDHGDTSFRAGQELDFSHPYAKGTARVVWNRILDGRVETGCLILTRA